MGGRRTDGNVSIRGLRPLRTLLRNDLFDARASCRTCQSIGRRVPGGNGELRAAVPTIRKTRVFGIHLLDGHCFEVGKVRFAGTKGFCGGFAPYELMPFGEGEIKNFVEIAEREAIKLDYGLAQLHTPVKIAITHYAPIKETVIGEPEPVFPFLGSSRLERALERHKSMLAPHGHAHGGTFSAEAQFGTRVCNVDLHILRERGEDHPFTIFTL